MKRDDWMLFSLTFLTGVAIGMYIYIGVFKPMYAPENLSDTEAGASEWNLVSRKRDEASALGYSQPSFRLLGDGSYTYLPGSVEGAMVEPREGTLSRALLRELRTYDDTLHDYSYTVSRSGCASDVGGYDYEYRFTKNTLTYNFDTCYTTLGDNTAFAALLARVWDEVEGRGTSFQGGNFSDWAEGWIRENIGVEGENQTR